nr:phage tail family protein [Clostridium caldaquaticum]
MQKFDGFGSVKNNISTFKSPFQDGATKQNSTLDLRDLSLEGCILAYNKKDMMEYRALLIRAFNPKYKGVLTYKYDGGEKQILCEVEEAPIFPHGNSYFTQTFNINLLCLNPFWLDTFVTGEEIISWIGGAAFPISFPISFATKGETKKNIINVGDVETPIEIIFKGPASNPKITNLLTGEFIRVKKSLTADETLIINTEFGNKKVEIFNVDGSKTNAFNYIDLNSTFFQLQVGDNVLEYSSENGIDPSSVSIKYKNRYIGV